MDDAKAEVLAFTSVPRTHWVKVWSTNPLERRNTDVQRRARVVGICRGDPPHRRRPRRCHDAWQAGNRRCLSAGAMAKLDPERDTGAVSALTSGD